MRTTWPAAWPALSVQKIFAEALDVLLSCLFFLDVGHPANPLIACDWREVIPRITECRIICQYFSQVRRYFMQDSGRDFLRCHRSIGYNDSVYRLKLSRMACQPCFCISIGFSFSASNISVMCVCPSFSLNTILTLLPSSIV